MVGENAAELAHHAGAVLIVEQQHGARGGDLDRRAGHPDDAGILGRSEERAPGAAHLGVAVEELDVQPLVEGDRFVGLLLFHRQSEIGGDGAHVDVVDVLRTVAAGAQVSLEDGPGDGVGRRKILGLASEGHIEPIDTRRRQLAEQAAELLAQGHIRLDLLEGLGIDARQIDRIADLAGEQEGADDLGDFEAALLLGLFGARSEVRGEHHVGQRAELVVGRQRFGGEHIQGRTGDLAGLQSGDQVGLVDDLAPGAVHDPHAGLHLGDGLGVDHAPGVGRDRHVHGDEIGGAVDGVGVGHQFDSQLTGTDLGEERIVGEDPHAEGEGALGYLGADAPHAQHAQGLALDLGALEGLPVPLARGHGGVGGGDLAGQRAQHEEGQFGRGDGVAGRRVHHHHAPLGRGGHIDIVDPHAGAAHHAEFRSGLEHGLGDLGLAADDDGFHIPEQGQQLRLGEPFGQDGHLEFGTGLEIRNAARRDGVANKNVHSAQRRYEPDPSRSTHRWVTFHGAEAAIPGGARSGWSPGSCSPGGVGFQWAHGNAFAAAVQLGPGLDGRAMGASGSRFGPLGDDRFEAEGDPWGGQRRCGGRVGRRVEPL